MSAPFRLLVPDLLLGEVREHAREDRPNECCGILAGRLEAGVGRVVVRYPLPNAAASPILYEADTRALLAVHRDMREQNLELLAVYHSHPTSRPVPSATDHRAWGHGPEVVCLIVSLLSDPPEVCGWWLLDEGKHRPAEVDSSSGEAGG